MLARYVVNPKDHHEASAALAGQSHTRPNFARGVAGWVLFIGLCGIVFVLMAQKPSGRGDAAMPPPRAGRPATPHFKIGMGMIVGGDHVPRRAVPGDEEAAAFSRQLAALHGRPLVRTAPSA